MAFYKLIQLPVVHHLQHLILLLQIQQVGLQALNLLLPIIGLVDPVIGMKFLIGHLQVEEYQMDVKSRSLRTM